jgi:hypothetical protein
MGKIGQSVTLHLAGKACQGQTLLQITKNLMRYEYGPLMSIRNPSLSL